MYGARNVRDILSEDNSKAPVVLSSGQSRDHLSVLHLLPLQVPVFPDFCVARSAPEMKEVKGEITNVAVNEPWTRVIRSKADSYVVSRISQTDGITLDRVQEAVAALSRATNNGERVLVSRDTRISDMRQG